jgi:hypothetical protein
MRRIGATTTAASLTRSVGEGLALVPAPTGRDSKARVGAQRRPGISRRLIPTEPEPHRGETNTAPGRYTNVSGRRMCPDRGPGIPSRRLFPPRPLQERGRG